MLDALEALIDKSLITITEFSDDGEVRYGMLDMVRTYLHEKLPRHEPEYTHTMRRMARHYRRLGEEAQAGLEGPQQLLWLRRLDQEIATIVQVLDFALEDEPGHPDNSFEDALQVIVGVWSYWETRHDIDLGLRLLEGYAQRADDSRSVSFRERAKLFNALGSMSAERGEYERSREYYQRCIEICRRPGAERNLAVASMNYANLVKRLGGYEQARRAFEEALVVFRKLGERRLIGLVQLNLGILLGETGETERAEGCLQQALEIAETAGAPDRSLQAAVLNSLGAQQLARENWERAKEYYGRAKEAYAELDERQGMARSLNNMGVVARHAGEPELALELLQECLAKYREMGSKHGQSVALVNLIPAAATRGELDRARQWLDDCLLLIRELRNIRVACFALEGAAELALAAGDSEEAAMLLAAAHSQRESSGAKLSGADARHFESNCERLRKEHADFDLWWRAGEASTLDEALDVAASLSKRSE